MADTIIRADRPGARIRRPKVYAGGRVCGAADCATVISKYNRAETCFAHRPVTFPRIRGKFVDESVA